MNGLKLITVTLALPAWTWVQLLAPFVLRSSEPSDVPASRDWLLDGSTASAKTAARP